MKLLTPGELSLHSACSPSGDALPRAEILAGGQPTGQVVTGVVLEAAVQWRDCRVLFLTDGIPFEDSLRISLFDARWHLVDSASLGGMYTTGAFSGLELLPPNTMRFRFIGGIAWVLELLEHGVLALPFTDPKGVSRPLGLLKRFKLHGQPLPETGH